MRSSAASTVRRSAVSPRGSRPSRTRTSHSSQRTDMRSVRVLAVGWLFHLKMLTRDPFNGLLQVLYPLFFATVAFFMFRVGDSTETLLYASLGASVMGIWSATSTSSGSAMQRERSHGTLELLVASPTPFAVVLLPV